MRLSVIMPSYNTPPTVLERSLVSVAKATSRDDEIIVVDDCSSRYQEAFNLIEKIYPTVVVVHEKRNRGQAYARNVGLSMAKGDFVAFIDSDDVVMRDSYELCIDALEKTNGDIAIYGVKTIWEDIMLYKIDKLPEKNYGVLKQRELEEFYDSTLFTYPWNKVYRRRFLDFHQIKFKECCIPREDEVLNLDCVINRAKWVSIDYVGHIYYHQLNSSLGRYRPYNRESNLMINKTRMKCMSALGISETENKGMKQLSEQELLLSDWRNIWRKGSPYTFLSKWRWLRANFNNQAFVSLVMVYVVSLAKFVARNYLYFKFLQSNHIKSLHKNICRLKSDVSGCGYEVSL